MNTNWLDRSEYPFEAKYLNINGAKMHYVDEGSGETLLIVHGTPSWSFEFRHLIRDLSKNYRVIAMDHIGFGLSDKPADYDYSVQNHAKSLAALIDHLQLKTFSLLVHDFGGPIGLSYAIQHPENIHQLIMINTWCRSAENDPSFIRMKRVLGSPLLPFLYKYFNFSARFIMPAAYGEKTRLTKKIHRQYTQAFGSPGERMGTIAFAKSLLNDQAWFESIGQQLHLLAQKPVLLIWGMKDNFVTEKYLNEFLEIFPQAQAVQYPDAGHFVMEEKSMVAIPVIREFLSRK